MAHSLSSAELTDWVKTHIVRFGQSAFRVSAGGLVVYIDIFQPLSAPLPADLVLVTHEHSDHFHAEALKSLLKPGTPAVFVAAMKAAGTDKGLATDTLAPGQTKTFAGLSVTAVPAYNVTAKFHPKEKNWVGYVFEIDGVRIYHCGDTDLIPEMTGLKADVLLLPVGGHYTMGWEEAVRTAELIQPGVVVPMHYGLVPNTGSAGRDFAKGWKGVTVLLEGE